ncbi:MAG: M24 family metallopeptidase [Rhizobiaceae bacterium]
MDERLERTAQAVRGLGTEWAVLTNFDSVCYATGHIVPIEAGPSPFSGGPTTAFVGKDGTCGLVAANVESAAAGTSRADSTILYEGFTHDHDADPRANYAAAVAEMKKRLGVRGVLATEVESFPLALSDILEPQRVVDLTLPLRRARATKTSEEMPLMRRAAETAAVGQSAFMKYARPGRTELDIFADVRAAMENHAQERVPVTGDFLSGRARTAAFTGWPIDRMVETGDPLISDLAPRVSGYWGDSCASAMLGEPSVPYLKLFHAAKGALDRALEIMRPGLVIADLDAALRSEVGRAGYAYPHHSGHSIGTSVHEWPRLVPYERAQFEAGMVVMVEPGAYDPEIGGVRTEWMIEITHDGCRPVAPFPHEPAIV